MSKQITPKIKEEQILKKKNERINYKKVTNIELNHKKTTDEKIKSEKTNSKISNIDKKNDLNLIESFDEKNDKTYYKLIRALDSEEESKYILKLGRNIDYRSSVLIKLREQFKNFLITFIFLIKSLSIKGFANELFLFFKFILSLLSLKYRGIANKKLINYFDIGNFLKLNYLSENLQNNIKTDSYQYPLFREISKKNLYNFSNKGKKIILYDFSFLESFDSKKI